MEKLLHELKQWFISLFTDVENALKPGIAFIAQNGGLYGLQLADQVLSQFEANASWSSIVAAFLAAAEKDGIALAEGAASAVLNAAKLNRLAVQSGIEGVPVEQAPANQVGLVSDPATVDANIASAQTVPAITNPDHPDYVAPVV